jgi:hypothetical protein
MAACRSDTELKKAFKTHHSAGRQLILHGAYDTEGSCHCDGPTFVDCPRNPFKERKVTIGLLIAHAASRKLRRTLQTLPAELSVIYRYDSADLRKIASRVDSGSVPLL